jgi:glycerol-3-phosphate dehydrogenase (NAD(P)+)
MNNKMNISVLGAGSWGTALASLLANNGHNVSLWSHNEAHLTTIKSNRENTRYLPQIALPESLAYEADLHKHTANSQVFLLVVPSKVFAETLDKLVEAGLPENALILWGTKGFDAYGKQLLSSLVSEKIKTPHQLAVVSGPSFALEVMQQKPTALTAASSNLATAENVAKLFHNDYVRVYANDDIAGVQVGGAVKNVLAIACGISDGLGFGANARSALITRGLVEISRLGNKLGAKTETFQGLSGVGDLVLTCTDDKSRNRRFGLGIGQADGSQSIEEIMASIGQEVEGYVTCKEVVQLAEKYQVDMPICQVVYAVVHQNMLPADAVSRLLGRAITSE